jgi:hypothetical protein
MPGQLDWNIMFVGERRFLGEEAKRVAIHK